MAKTLQQKAEEVAVAHGLETDTVTVHKKGSKSIISVQLPNGREINTDNVDGWEATLSRNIKKFINKK